MSGVVLIGASALAVGLYSWFAFSLLLPLVHADRGAEYLFLGAPSAVGFVAATVTALLVVLLHRRWMAPAHGWSWTALSYLVPLLLLAVAPFAALALVPPLAGVLPAALYVLVDLRVWWTTAILAAVLLRFDRLRGSPVEARITRVFGRTSDRARGWLLDAALFLGVALFAFVASPHLRFTGILHGDEPKYIRYCESFYQGLGVEVGHQRMFDDLTLSYSPPVWRNAAHLAAAVRSEAVNLAADARRFLADRSFTFNRGKYTDAWFFIGKDGGFHQVHNPGLPALLFPAYVLDRHFISWSAGYQGVFPRQLPATNLALLLIWSLWAVVLFRLLSHVTGRRMSAWGFAALAMTTLPVSAFAFQIYPESAGGLIVASVFVWLMFGNPDGRRTWQAAAAGAAAAFLPWLHIRMILLSLIFFAAAMLALRRRRFAFALPFAIVLAALSLYSYHLTGSLRPDAMYATPGAPSPWALGDALQSVLAIPFDRIWGFFPHAPVYLFAVAGLAPMLRQHPRPGIVALLLVAALVAAAAGHGFTAAGATPLRQSVAVIPLLMIPLACAWVTWGHRPWFRAAFAVLAVVSLDASWSYKRAHIKETGRMIDTAVSGWAPNLLFPWTHGIPWAEWRGTFVLLLIWLAVIAAIVIASIVFSGTQSAAPSTLQHPEAPRTPPHPAAPRRTLKPAFAKAPARSRRSASRGGGHLVTATAVFMVAATLATALGGEWTRGDYFMPVADARAAAAAYAAGTDRCRICFSSLRGELGRATILPDSDVRLRFAAEHADVPAGGEARFVAAAEHQDAPAWGTLALDFGDGRSTRLDIYGGTAITHVYGSAGVREAVARLSVAGRPPQQASVTVIVRPTTLAIGEVDGLPAPVRASPERGTVGRVLLGAGGPSLETAAPDGSTLWGIVWDGARWQARNGDALRYIQPGAWVALVRSDANSRSAPVFVRWPDPLTLLGAPLVLTQ